MSKRRLRFFLDYGYCFWEEGGTNCGLSPKDLQLSADVQCEVTEYLREYNSAYNCGCPPSNDWTVEDSQRFNAETRRILGLVEPELKSQFIICHEQEDIVEDPEVLAEILKDRRAFIERQQREHFAQ